MISTNDIGGDPMPRKALSGLTESMFYVLMALCRQPMCGIEVADFVDTKTQGEVRIGPATLYTILGKFEREKYIEVIEVSGRRRTYSITAAGLGAYAREIRRLQRCLDDAASEESQLGRESRE